MTACINKAVGSMAVAHPQLAKFGSKRSRAYWESCNDVAELRAQVLASLPATAEPSKENKEPAQSEKAPKKAKAKKARTLAQLRKAIAAAVKRELDYQSMKVSPAFHTSVPEFLLAEVCKLSCQQQSDCRPCKSRVAGKSCS